MFTSKTKSYLFIKYTDCIDTDMCFVVEIYVGTAINPVHNISCLTK